MAKATGGKKRRTNPIYDRFQNDTFSFDDAKSVISAKLNSETRRTQWVAQDDSRVKKTLSKLSSTLLATFIKKKGLEEDMIETLLAHQMAALHNLGTECARRAMLVDRSDDYTTRYLNNALKCLSAFARHVEVLDKHRGKGQQRITVQHQHVNVQPGGQAAIANFGDGAPQAAEELKRPLQQVARPAEQPFTIDSDQPALASQSVKRTENDSQA